MGGPTEEGALLQSPSKPPQVLPARTLPAPTGMGVVVVVGGQGGSWGVWDPGGSLRGGRVSSELLTPNSSGIPTPLHTSNEGRGQTWTPPPATPNAGVGAADALPQ